MTITVNELHPKLAEIRERAAGVLAASTDPDARQLADDAQWLITAAENTRTKYRQYIGEVAAQHDALERELAEWRGSTNAYLIWSHHHAAWWGPNAQGYRGNVNDAGRYALADTKQYLGRGCYCCTVPEVTVPAPLPGQMDSASVVKLIAVATEAEVAAGRVNKHAEAGVAR